jgi:hypothetical protein
VQALVAEARSGSVAALPVWVVREQLVLEAAPSVWAAWVRSASAVALSVP